MEQEASNAIKAEAMVEPQTPASPVKIVFVSKSYPNLKQKMINSSDSSIKLKSNTSVQSKSLKSSDKDENISGDLEKTAVFTVQYKYAYIRLLLFIHATVFSITAALIYTIHYSSDTFGILLQIKEYETTETGKVVYHSKNLGYAALICIIAVIFSVVPFFILFCNNVIRVHLIPCNILLFIIGVIPGAVAMGLITYFINDNILLYIAEVCAISSIVMLNILFLGPAMDRIQWCFKYFFLFVIAIQLIICTAVITLKWADKTFSTATMIQWTIILFLSFLLMEAIVFDAFLAVKCREPQRNRYDFLFGVTKFYVDAALAIIFIGWIICKLMSLCCLLCKKNRRKSEKEPSDAGKSKTNQRNTGNRDLRSSV